MTGKSIGDKVMAFARQKKVSTMKQDVWELAQIKGLKTVIQVQNKDGTVTFQDESGKTITPAGMFVPSAKATKNLSREA